MVFKSKYLPFFLSLILLAGCQLQSKAMTKDIVINDSAIRTEVALTESEAAKGLSGRTELCADCGMLFEYPDYQVRYYWMKGMNFPLDIIWLKDGRVVGFAQNVPVVDQAGNITRVSSPEAVNRVLEVSAGFVSQKGIKAGDEVSGLD